MKDTYKVVFAGGGSGGHIYPGIAVADALKTEAEKRGIKIEIYWIGNKTGIDKSILEKNLVTEGGSITAFYGISCGKLRRYLSFKNFTDMFRIISGYFQSKKILKKIRPICLFSKGGFVSVTPCRAAKSLKVPYYTHECDFTPGLATRLNSKHASKILLSYEETKKFFTADVEKCTVTGNPVRPIFWEDNSAKGLDFLKIDHGHKKPVLLVIGGSLGASQINSLVSENLEWLCEHFIVVHQTGKQWAQEHPETFQKASENYKPFEFIYAEMPWVLQASDVVLSRAGANSLWECAVCEKPMLLIPLCRSGTRGDQVDNAKYLEDKGAAITLIGDKATGDSLKERLELLTHEEQRKQLSLSCRKLTGETKSAVTIANIILEGIK